MTRFVPMLVLVLAACGGGDGNTGSIPAPDGGASGPALYEPCFATDTCSRGECVPLTDASSVCTDRCTSHSDCRLGGLCYDSDGPARGPVCFARCSRDGDCPAGWVCEDTPDGAICAPTR